MIDNNCGKEKVWVPNPEKGWINGDLIKEIPGEGWLVRDENGKEIKIEKDELRMQNPVIQEGIDDMTSLSHLHEAAVIHNLIKRYEINSIYTYTGSILIAINPYTKLPIYSKEMIESFCDQPVSKLAPHVYSIAESAYREMLNFQKNQSILVSGESGAGKTETTKFLLQYFAAMGEKGNGVNTSLISEEDIVEGNNIETQVIKSTPILEAFGNSKTLRNDNSSRFGKFIEIHFDKIKGTIVGAKLETYLLEKSRIVKPPENERGYHIFYQLIKGFNNSCCLNIINNNNNKDEDSSSSNNNIDDLKSLLKCKASDFNYLISSGCDSIDGVDDSQVFIKTENALKVMGLSNDELIGIYKILLSILHIGNIEFEKGKEEDSSIIKFGDSSFGESFSDGDGYNPLELSCKLLGCSVDSLKSTFCSRKMKAGNESYTINHTVEQASQARDSLSMFLYSRLFDWLVVRINQSIDKIGTEKKDNSFLFIGILDIYGFESFESNSYEQFTINYANEKLQNQFNHQIFKLEQLEYEKEKIDWSYIEFSDNQDCIDLIEKKPLGILSILDEESQFPKSTPSTLCTKLYNNHSKSKNFEKPRFSQTHFIIDHYAGKVEYDTNLFLEKNKDFIISEQVSALESSNWKFLTNLFQILSKKMNGGGGSGTSGGGSGAGGNKSSSASKSTFKFTSVSSQFKESLNSLMTTINSTNPHYIRCIKPNTEKRANLFDNVMVLHQLRCSGVIEQLRISRSGYPSRLVYDNFIKRYKLIVAKDFKNDDDSNESKEWNSILKETDLNSSNGGSTTNNQIELKRKGAELMINKLSIDISSVQFGLTKLFFKSGIIANLELLRSQTMINSATFIQKIWRGYTDRKAYTSTKQSSIYFQSLIRSYLQQLEYNSMVEENSAIHLQSLIRTNELEKQFNQLLSTTIHFQSLLRRLEDSKEFNTLMDRIKKIVKIQSLWRSNLAKKQLKLLKAEAKSLTNVVAEKNKLASKLGDIQSKLDMESQLAQKIKNENEQLSSQFSNIQIEKEKLQKDFGNINLEKEELLLKYSALESEYDQYKQQNELIISKLKQHINDLEEKQHQQQQHSYKNNEIVGNTSFEGSTTTNNGVTSPPKSSPSSPIRNSINSNSDTTISGGSDDGSIDNTDSLILSPKQHKGEDRKRSHEISSISPPRSRETIGYGDDDNNYVDVIPRQQFNELEKEYKELKQMDETHKQYIESLKLQITQLEEKVKKSSSHPRSLLPGIPSNINDSPKVVYTKSSITNDNSSSHHQQQQQQHNISPSNSITSTTSPINMMDSNIKSLSYKDFTNSQEIDAQQQLHQYHLNNGTATATSTNGSGNPLSQSSPTGSDKHIQQSTISDLVSALNFNNCQLESGKYLVDLIIKNHDSIVSKYVPSEMGGIPEPVFILSRCFLKNIYDVDATVIGTPNSTNSGGGGGGSGTGVLDPIETNANILIYFCDKVEEVIYRDPKSNCSALCYWFSNFYTLFNIMETYNQDTKDQLSLNDQDKALIEKLKITLQTMIVKAHKNVVKNITDYIQPILHKSLNDTTSEIDFMDPITNYLNQIQISLSLENCYINNNLCKLLFEQLFSFINAMIFNEILLRKDLCCLRSSIPIKMNISELEHWVKLHHGKEWSLSVCDKLRLLKEVVYILMIDKTQLQNDELRDEICPTLSIAQLKQLLTMYSPDVDSFEDPIPLEILTSLMDSPKYNPDENILLDLSKIFTLKFINSNQTLSSSTSSENDLMATINLNALESVQYACDDLVSNIVKKNIEIVSLNNQKSIKK
ncbi:hypothetical protein ACTFIW_008142 [Dictyostelium discoideum]